MNKFHIGLLTYPTLRLAMEAMNTGDVLNIDQDDYPLDCGTLLANGCVINTHKSVFHSIIDGKATFNIEGNDTVINDPVGNNIHSLNDGNGGLIRLNGRNITINGMEVYDTDMPYLSGLHQPLSVETINRPKIRGTKQSNPHITNIGHALYFGVCGWAIVNEPDIIGSIPSNGEWQDPFVRGPFDAEYFGYGHLVKSRAQRLTINGGQLIKGPHTSRCIDACLGGIVELGSGLRLVEDQSPDNFDLMELGGESYGPDNIGWDPVTETGVRSPRFAVNSITIDPSVVIENQNPRADPYRIHCYISPVSISGIDPKYITMPTGTSPIIIQPVGDPPMATITVIVPEGTDVQVLNALPVDTTALVALQARFDAYVTAVKADAQVRKDADNAKVDGQNLLDLVP